MGSDTGFTFTSAAMFAYDAVWSMGLGMDAVSASLACNGSLGDYDPLERGAGREVGRCIAALLTSRISTLSFDGLSVYFVWHLWCEPGRVWHKLN